MCYKDHSQVDQSKLPTASYDPEEEWIELNDEEGKCSNCYHEHDFPHVTMVRHKYIPNYTMCMYCYS